MSWKTTLSFRSLPADFHGKFFPLYFLKDKMLACKDIYLEGPCGKFSVTNTFQWQLFTEFNCQPRCTGHGHELYHKLIAYHSLTPLLPSESHIAISVRDLNSLCSKKLVLTSSAFQINHNLLKCPSALIQCSANLCNNLCFQEAKKCIVARSEEQKMVMAQRCCCEHGPSFVL